MATKPRPAVLILEPLDRFAQNACSVKDLEDPSVSSKSARRLRVHASWPADGYTLMAMLFARTERTDRSFRRQSESTFQFLDRIAGPFWDRVRALMEDWLAEYPETHRGELVSRLRDDDASFRSAYWELYLAALVHAHGGTVTCHPSVPGTKNQPDFLVEGLGEPFYLEAKVLEQGGEEGVRSRSRDEIWEGLNDRVTSEHFFVALDIEKYGRSAPPISKLAKSVDDWLTSLDPSAVNGRGDDEQFNHYWADPSTGWEISLRLIRKSRHSPEHRLVAMGGAESGFFGDREDVRNAITKKYKHYGTALDQPLIVALAVHRIGVDDWDVDQALFGDEVLIWDSANPGNARGGRARNGLWLDRTGPRATRLSAVLTAERIAPWGVAESRLVLWRNPWAQRPVELVFSNALRVELVDDRLVRIDAGEKSRECFALADDWPGPERAFDEKYLN